MSNVGEALLYTGFVVAPLITIPLYFATRHGQAVADTAPQSLADTQITQAQEGGVVPLIYGRVKIPGNIVWFGNLRTEPIESDAGGKGGGDDVVTGQKYYVDCWQVICQGKTNLKNIYIEDKETTPIELFPADYAYWNDGDSPYYPPTGPAFVNAFPGVASFWAHEWLLGDNVGRLKSLQFLVERVMETPVDYQNLENGANPAAIIYDVLYQAGVTDANEINVATFNASAAYWHEKGYGLNLVYSSQQSAAEIISNIFSYVGGVLYYDNEGKYALQHFDPAQAPVATLTADQFKKFSLSRPSYSEIPNDFRGNFHDGEKEYEQRTVVAKNEAAIIVTGYTSQQSIDLTAFRSVDAASKRIYEIMKTNSYPGAEIKLSGSLELSVFNIGDVILISHEDYNLVNMPVRLVSIDFPTFDKNEIEIVAKQQVESLFDDKYSNGGGSTWVGPDYSDLAPFSKVSVFELPHNRQSYVGYNYKTRTGILYLVAREQGYEAGFSVATSADGTNFSPPQGYYGTFSQYGVLDEEYPANTYTIDDERGILYTPFREDPIFSSISRAQLFSEKRFALIDNEMLCFQTVSYEGPNSIRLSGVRRGVLNTPRETHSAGSAIWITEAVPAGNVGITPDVGNYLTKESWHKIIPRFQKYAGLITEATIVHFQPINKAGSAPKPHRIVATRTGNSVYFLIYYVHRGIFIGSSTAGELEMPVHGAPPTFNGVSYDFMCSYDDVEFLFLGNHGTIEIVGEKEVSFRQIVNINTHAISEPRTITVGAADGVYISGVTA